MENEELLTSVVSFFPHFSPKNHDELWNCRVPMFHHKGYLIGPWSSSLFLLPCLPTSTPSHCFLHDPTNVGNSIPGPSAFSKSSLNTWNFLVHILLRPSLKNFEHNLASMWNENNSMVVWTFFGIAVLGGWNENWPLPVLWPLLSFPNSWHIECSTLSFRI